MIPPNALLLWIRNPLIENPGLWILKFVHFVDDEDGDGERLDIVFDYDEVMWMVRKCTLGNDVVDRWVRRISTQIDEVSIYRAFNPNLFDEVRIFE